MIISLRRSAMLIVGCFALLASCASPPLRLYTLGAPFDYGTEKPHGSARLTTIEISRTILPDYLDCQDIIIRKGQEIVRSPRSRWASRLSLGITDLMTNEIASFHPDKLITDQPLADAANMRLQINISLLDVNADGHATLNANWAVIPRDPQKPLIRNRVHLSARGSVATDADTAALMRKLVIQLADKVSLSIPATP